MNNQIIYEFVNFYYKCLNEKNSDLYPYFIEHSELMYNNNYVKGEQIIEFLLKKCTNTNYNVSNITFLINGSRRANIVVSGTLNDFEKVYLNKKQKIEKKFTDFIHLAFGNNKQYWIHNIISHTN